jgi:uncharacterized RDD family membrane protein YckC
VRLADWKKEFKDEFVVIEHKYSTFWPRFWAGFIDALVFLPLEWVYQWTFPHLSIALRVVVFAFYSSAFLIYDIWMLGRFGQTLGKMACKVIVLDVSEGPLSFRQAALRDIFGIVSVAFGLTMTIPRIVHGIDITADVNLTPADYVLTFSSLAWFAVELITMFTNSKRRSLHDFIAGSVVIRKESRVTELGLDNDVTGA